MTPVSPHLRWSGLALLAGAGIATLAVAVAPGPYYDLTEWRLFDLPYGRDGLAQGVTIRAVVADLLLAVVMFLFAKEVWEALRLERGGLAGRQAMVPVAAVLGGLAMAAVVWTVAAALFETAEEAAGAPGWVVPMGSDVVLAVLFGRLVFGPAHPALQLLLFLTILGNIVALAVAGLVAPGPAGVRLAWLALPAGSALLGWAMLTRPLSAPDVTERARARGGALLPWIALAGVSWAGVAASGLPPALGLLPILPAMPHARRSFGLFAEAEGFLTDPLNRAAHWAMPAMAPIFLLFGLTHGGLDLAALSVTSAIVLAAFWLGKPAGVLAVLVLARRARQGPTALPLADLARVALLCGIGLTVPALALETALPGGAMQEAARLGLGLTLLIGPVLVLATRLRGPAA